MARFYGTVGYVTTIEDRPGIWIEDVSERSYYGDTMLQISRWQVNSEHLNDDLSMGHKISIVADPFAYENFHFIKFVRWNGVCWKVNSIEIQRPRLILYLGGVYNEPTV